MSKIVVGVTLNPETNKAYTQEEATLHEFKSATKTAFDEYASKMISKEEHQQIVDSMTQKITESKEASDELKRTVEKLHKGLIEQAKEAQERANGNQGGRIIKSIHEQLNEQLNGNQAALKSMYESNTRNERLNFTVKAAGTMSTANVTGTAMYATLSSVEPGITRFVRRSPYLRQIMNVRPINSMYATWVEQTAADGGAGVTAEGAAKTQADFDLIEQSKKVEKITSYIKVTKENLADIPYLASTINSELMDLIELKLDDQLYSGSGTTPNLKGLTTYATAFSVASTALADSIASANRNDCLRAGVWQVRAANHNPTHILLNPIDITMMDLTKDSTGQYLLPPFLTADGSRIAGCQIIENNGVTAGDFLIGDFSKAVLGVREELNIEIDRDADDFTKNLYTVLAEMRAVHYIKSQNTTAFVKGTFSTAIAALLP